MFDVQLRRESIGTVLRVIIDRPDRGVVEAPDEAVGIEECQRVSHDLSALLDVEEEDMGEAALAKEYTLEVSSPGVGRPLTAPRHFQRNIGRLVAVQHAGAETTGRVRAADAASVTLEVPATRTTPARLVTVLTLR